MYPFLQFAPFLHVLFNYIRSIFGVRTFSTTPDFCEFCRELSLESFQQPLVFSTSILQSTCPSCTLIRNVLTNDGTRPLSLYPDKLSMSLQNEKNYLSISITRVGGHSLNRISVDLALSSPSQRETFSVFPVAPTADLNLAKELSEVCAKHHSSCSKMASRSGENTRRLRVIDVEGRRLTHIRPSDGVPYIALSYVWGGDVGIKTKSTNVDEYTVRLPSPMPLTYEESIEVVRAFGMRYLWIDALCIVQDDDEDINRHVNAMDHIYAEAYVTIAAMVGDSAEAGLGLRRPKVETYIDMPNMNGYQLSRSPEITALSPCLDKVVWASRGWTFQERMLSRKLLMFTTYFMLYHCSLTTKSEPGWMLRFGRDFDVGVPVPRVRSRGVYKEWPTIVEAVTTRHVTNSSDLIPAVTGIAQVVQKTYGARVVMGLCEQNLHTELLWKASPPTTLKPAEAGRIKVPSWSWASWVGHVMCENKSGEITPESRITVLPEDSGIQRLIINAPSKLFPFQKASKKYLNSTRQFGSLLHTLYHEDTTGLRIPTGTMLDGSEGLMGWFVFDSEELAERYVDELVQVLVIAKNKGGRDIGGRRVLLVSVKKGSLEGNDVLVGRRIGTGEIREEALTDCDEMTVYLE